MNTNQIVTLADLEKFKTELFAELHKVIKRTKSQTEKKWLKTSEVIKMLNVSPGKLQTMRKSGALSFMKIGGTLYYELEDIDKMFDKFKIKNKDD